MGPLMSTQTSSDAPPAQEKKDGGLGTSAPKRKPRKPVSDLIVYIIVRVVIFVFRILPAPLARSLGRGLGLTAWALLGRYRRQILRHMDIAFRDEVPLEDKKRWCRQNFQHVGQSLVEFARMKYLNKDNVGDLIDLTDCKVIDEQLAKSKKGKGLLCVVAHHGNWELCGYAVSIKGYPLESVARPLDNPRLNKLIQDIREESGNHIIEKWQVLWKLKKLLDKGGIVTISVDQNGGVAGLFVPLFKTLASTVTSPAELHIATRVPIVVVSLNRQPDWVHHKFNVWDVIEPKRTDDHKADVEAAVRRINAAYEKAITAFPEQWLWVHRRWKSRPEGEEVGPDGLPPRIKVN